MSVCKPTVQQEQRASECETHVLLGEGARVVQGEEKRNEIFKPDFVNIHVVLRTSVRLFAEKVDVVCQIHENIREIADNHESKNAEPDIHKLYA